MDDLYEGYPCTECEREPTCRGHRECWEYKCWFGDVWEQVTKPFKRKEEKEECTYRLFGVVWRQQSSQK